MSGETNRRILRLAVPSILAAISTPVIGIADTAMVGHLPDVAMLGGVAAASVIFDVLFWSTGFLRMGTTSLVAQYFGSADRSACAATLWRSLAVALLLGAGMWILREPIAEVGFRLAGGTPDVAVWGRRYLAVRVLSAPLVLASMTLNGFFLGTANAVAPLCVTLAASLVNVAADYALVFGRWGAPALGVTGAAWAAVMGNLAGLSTGGALLVWRYREYLAQPVRGLLDRDALRLLLRTNGNLFGRTQCLLFAQLSMLGIVARLGEVPLAANAIVWQVWSLASFGIDGFAHAAEILVGNALGMRDFAAARRLARRTLAWGLGVGGAFGLAYLVLLQPIAAAFTAHRGVVGMVASLALLVAPIQPLNAAVFVLDGVLIGANDTAYLFRAMAVAAFGVFVPAALLCVWALDWGIHGAWVAYDGLMLGRLLTLLPRYRGDAWLRSFTRPGATMGGAPP